MIKKQTWLIAIGALALTAMLLAWYFLIPQDEENQTPTQVEYTRMFDQIPSSQMQSIEVHNAEGTYVFYRDKNDQFMIRGMEGAPYSQTVFAQLVVETGNTLATFVCENCEDLSTYGLDKDYAWYVITKKTGERITVRVGDKTVDGKGYYACLDGEDSVYILASTLEKFLFSNVYSMITPVLCYPLPENGSYKTDNFFLLRDNELVVAIDYVPESEEKTDGGMGQWRMKKPAQYAVDTTGFSAVITWLATPYGTETVEFGSALSDAFFKDAYEEGAAGDADFSADAEKYYQHLKEKYNIDVKHPAYMLSYSYEKYLNYVIFSEPDITGNMYAYSSMYDLVAKIHVSSVPFLEWDLVRFVDRSLFAYSINDVAKIEIESPAQDLNCTFFLDGSGQDIRVTTNLSSKVFEEAMYDSFQEWYREFIMIKIQDRTESNAKENLYAKATVTLDSGNVFEYAFYQYSTRHCYATINGKGEFYVLFDRVEKFVTDAGRLMRGETVEDNGRA